MTGHIYTIPHNLPFADTLVRFVFSLAEQQNNAAFALHDITLFVPSPRVAQTLHETFARHTQTGLLLPRITPITPDDATGDWTLLNTPAGQTPALAPVSPASRTAVFARQLKAKDPNLTYTQALENAAKLGQLMDRLTLYDVDIAHIRQHFPHEMATHWQENWDFLQIVFQFYPAWLQAQNKTDFAQYNKNILLALAEYYTKTPPKAPVIAAGFADTTPTGARLIRSILQHKTGVLVLPGYPVEVYPDVLPPTHPHHGMQQLLQRLYAANDSQKEHKQPAVQLIPPMPAEKFVQAPPLWLQAMAADLKRTQQTSAPFTLLQAGSKQEEAEAIALVLKQAHEEGLKAAVVTPNRELGERVSACLAQWDINPDNSAGTPLVHTSEGRLAMLVLHMVQGQFRPLKTTSFLQHPLVSCGFDKPTFKETAAWIEKNILRQPHPTAALPKNGFLPVFNQCICAHKAATTPLAKQAQQVLHVLAQIKKCLNTSTPQPLSVWMRQHIQALHLAVGEHAAADFFASTAGSQLIATFETWQQADDDLGLLNARSYNEFMAYALGKEVVRPVFNVNKHIKIWGALEGRLQSADVLILADVNEGTWPQTPTPDPWLGHRLTTLLGLPTAYHAVGLNAHDFVSLASQPNVVISRSSKENGSELLPSRFLSRMAAVLPREAWQAAEARGDVYVRLAQTLRRKGNETQEHINSANVPLALRPHTWSASLVKDLLACPVKAYAKKVLGLYKWQPLEAPATAAEKGQILHDIMFAFYRQQPNLPPAFDGNYEPQQKQQAKQTFLAIADAVLNRTHDKSAALLWQQRMPQLAEDFVQTIFTLYSETGQQPFAFEQEATTSLAGGITLQARADRVDLSAQGIHIIDYKTGIPPSIRKVLNGEEPQLGVESYLAAAGAFGTPDTHVAEATFWQIKSGGTQALARSGLKGEATQTLLQSASEGLQQLVDYYTVEENAYFAVPGDASGQQKRHICQYCDYAGICRFRDRNFKAAHTQHNAATPVAQNKN